MKTNKLTTRQFRLHDFIKSGNGKRFTKRDIFENVDGYVWHEKASDKCPAIRTDMKAINESSEVDSIIVFDHQEYYTATLEQALEFIERKKRTIKTCGREISVLTHKLRKDGQFKLLNNQNNVIKDTDRPYYLTLREN